MGDEYDEAPEKPVLYSKERVESTIKDRGSLNCSQEERVPFFFIKTTVDRPSSYYSFPGQLTSVVVCPHINRGHLLYSVRLITVERS